MGRLLASLLLILCPAAAEAGTRATYVDQQGYRRTILIADNGDLDVEIATGGRLLVRDGRAFVVEERLTGPLVTPLEELAAAASEPRPARRPPSPEQEAAMREAMAAMEAATNEAELMVPAAAQTERADEAPPRLADPALVRRDGIEVNARSGRGYFIPADDFQGERLFAVMSDDPALAAIGAAFRRALDAQNVLLRLTWDSPSPPWEMDTAWRAVLASGTPIQYFDSRLRSVEQVAIPAISLPAEPETGTALRARLAAETAARDAPMQPEWNASRALFAGGRLYLVAGNQRLLSLADGEQALTPHELGEPVLDACVQDDSPLALTGAEDTQAWTLRRLRDGQWHIERRIARDNDQPVALACNPEGAFLLTSRRFIDLTRTQVTPLQLQGEPLHALVTAAVLVTPEAVFVGLNAGEWGGGLRRIDRRTGRIETLQRNATGDLCDGPLNTDCDPVQGLAPIPWRPDCVAAAIGLIHMMAHGRLTMVCRDRIEQLYAAMDIEPEDPERRRETAQGGLGSVAFFGLAATGNELLAIGHDGLYRVHADGTAHRVPLPRFTRIGGVLVSFALPDVVLVVTGINGRASMSGAVPIMALR